MAVLALLLLAVPVAAGETEVTTEKRVCRAAAPTLGSRIKKPRICRTEAQWDEEERARRAAPITVKAPQPEPWERTRPQ